MLRTITCIAVLALPLSTPLAAESPEPADQREALQNASDEDLVETTRKAVEDIYAEFAPGLEDSDEKARKRIESTPIEVSYRRMLTSPGIRRPLLLATVSGGKPMATASTGCDLAAVFTYTDDGLEVSAHKPVCTGGNTSRNLEYDGLSMGADVPLVTLRTRQTRRATSSLSYTLFRVDRDRFEKVLSVSTTRPPSKEASLDCGRPRFTTRDIPGNPPSDARPRLTTRDVPGSPRPPGMDAYPDAIVATVVCRRDDSPEAHRLFSRIWTWTDDGYTEQPLATPDSYSSEMQHPPQLGGEPEPDDTDDSSDE